MVVSKSLIIAIVVEKTSADNKQIEKGIQVIVK